jgi:plasmid stability protein
MIAMISDHPDHQTPPLAPRTTSLLVRNLDPQLKEALRVRAARHGHSMAAEVREILEDTVGQSKRQHSRSLAESIHQRFAALGGVMLDEHPPVPVGEPVRFDP